MPVRSHPCCWTGQDAAKLFSTPERHLKCKPPGLMREQAFSSTQQVSRTFPLLSLKQSDFVWPCKRPFWRGLCVTQEFLEMSAECKIWPTAVILLQYSWLLRMPEMPEDVVIFCVIIWIGLPKSRNWGWDSVRLARASVSCWRTEVQRDWWELVNLGVSQDQTYNPLGITIAPCLIWLS